MLQSMGSQRVERDLATEQQQNPIPQPTESPSQGAGFWKLKKSPAAADTEKVAQVSHEEKD